MYISRENITHVVRGIIYNAADDILVVRKNPNARYGGSKWGFVGGQVEPKDGSKQATLVREAYEEAGIEIVADPAADIWEHQREYWAENVRKLVVTSFIPALACTERLRIDGTELVDGMWTPGRNVRLLDLVEASRFVLDAAGLASELR